MIDDDMNKLRKIMDYQKATGMINDYKLSDDGAVIELNPVFSLRLLSSYPVVVINRCLVDIINQLSHDAACILLYYLCIAAPDYSRQSMTPSEMSNAINLFSSHLNADPTIIGDIAIYHSYIPSAFSADFDAILDSLMPSIIFSTPPITDMHDYDALYIACIDNPPRDLKSLACRCNLNEEQVRDDLWYLTTKGLITFGKLDLAILRDSGETT